MKRTLAVAAAVAALLSAAPGAAQAAPVDDKNLCKSGGFANYVDPTTDLPFKNQGRCVSFVNGGGVLVPVEEEPPVPVAPTAKLLVGGFAAGAFAVAVEAQGSPNASYALTVGSEIYTVTTNADGLAAFTINIAPEITLAVSYQGQEIGSIVTPSAPTTTQWAWQDPARQWSLTPVAEGCHVVGDFKLSSPTDASVSVRAVALTDTPDSYFGQIFQGPGPHRIEFTAPVDREILVDVRTSRYPFESYKINTTGCAL